MTANSKIEWTDHTFNPWEGCQKVGPGCDHCYAETRNARFAGGTAINWGPGAPRRRTSVSNWNKPRIWNANADKFFTEHGRRQRVFCASLADVFDNAVDPTWRAELFDLIASTPNLDWLLLTKRIGNAAEMMLTQTCWNPLNPLPNIWIGATVVNQKEADRDIPKLLATPARTRFLSMEPLLGPVSLRNIRMGSDSPIHRVWGIPSEYDHFDALHGANRARLDWVIVGGESGHKARPMHPDWVRSLRDQCAAAGVPFLFKQWGEWMSDDFRTVNGRGFAPKRCEVAHDGRIFDSFQGWINTVSMMRVGKKESGRLLDGVQHDGFPEIKP